MDVSENSGTPKSSILIGFSIINHPFWGTPNFWKTPKLSAAKLVYTSKNPRFDGKKKTSQIAPGGSKALEILGTGEVKQLEVTLQGTNISPKNGILKMIFLFPRWDMLIPRRVLEGRGGVFSNVFYVQSEPRGNVSEMIQTIGGGGNSHIFWNFFTPEPWGRWSNLTSIFFSKGLVQLPTCWVCPQAGICLMLHLADFV